MPKGNSLQLLPPVLVVPLPLDVMLLETGLESPSGEWAGGVSVLLYTDQHPPPFVDQGIPSQLCLGLDLEHMALHSYQH